jgi:uncharacterized membrane protein (DUF4010 family)
MEDSGAIVTAFVVAAGLGAIIGLERQVRGEQEDPAAADTYAGVRTFALYGAWGAGAGFLADRFGSSAFLVAALAFGALLIATYVGVGIRTSDWGTTTEAAAFVTFIVGALAWDEQWVAALAVAVGTAYLLRSKEFFHGMSRRFSEDDIKAVLQFAAITAVVLPLIPNEEFGPFDAINPRKIWLMVIFVAGIGLVGYVSLRLLGSRGLTLTGFLGGLVSSTAVTLGFARMSKTSPATLTNALSAGIIAASGLMYGRVLVEAYVIEPDLGEKLLLPLSILFLLVEGAAFVWWRRSQGGAGQDSDLQLTNPLTLTSALQFGALYGVIIFASKALLDRASEASLNLVGAVSGINDVDAITLSTADLVETSGLDPHIGAQVVLAAVAVNTLVKAGMAVALGNRALGRSVGATLGVAAVLAGLAWLLV